VTRLIGAELLKLRTTRAFYSLAGGALAFTIVITLLGTLLEPEEAVLRDVSQVAFFAQLLVLVIGILCVTNEFRHGTITPTLLVTPDRTRLTIAKLLASMLVGLVIGLTAICIIALVVALTPKGSAEDAGKFILGGALLGMLYGALGVGVGAVVRNQVGAIIGALVYLFMLESLVGLIPGVRDVLPKYGIGGTSEALRGSESQGDTEFLAQLPGGLLLALYCALFVLAGIALIKRRDVTA